MTTPYLIRLPLFALQRVAELLQVQLCHSSSTLSCRVGGKVHAKTCLHTQHTHSMAGLFSSQVLLLVFGRVAVSCGGWSTPHHKTVTMCCGAAHKQGCCVRVLLVFLLSVHACHTNQLHASHHHCTFILVVLYRTVLSLLLCMRLFLLLFLCPASTWPHPSCVCEHLALMYGWCEPSCRWLGVATMVAFSAPC